MVKIKFEFPDTGEGVTEGKFLDWKVEEGDKIEEDEVVGEAETDKAVVEIPAPADGHVENLLASPGDKVQVGDVIMELDTGDSGTSGKSGESSEAAENTSENGKDDRKESSGNPVIEDVPVANSSSTDNSKANKNNVSSSSGEILALPKVRKLAEEKNVNLASIKTGERIFEEEVIEAADHESEAKSSKDPESAETSSDSSSDVKATPSVRKLAREKGINISEVEGSGRGGKVTRQDVLEFEESEDRQEKSGGKSSTSVSKEVESHPVHSDRETERIEISGIKEKTAERMAESRFTAPHVTHVEKADVTELKELRNREKENIEPHLTYLPFVMKAVSEALSDYPELNAELDTEENELVYKKYYDFNIAVDTENGLLIPRIKNVDNKSIVELASEIGGKAEKAKNRKISPKELENGTFSITNLGVIGGEEFTPIITPPQTCILGVGRIGETAEVVDGEVVPRTTVKLSLSYDHRLVDGATAARFMNEVVENLENPEKMLLEL